MAVSGFRQDLGEQTDIVELPGLEDWDVDGKARVDQPSRRTATDPDVRPARGFGCRCTIHRRRSVAIDPKGSTASGLGR